MYYVQWKFLLILGVVFWILLCITDLLGDHKIKYLGRPVTVEDIMEDHSLIDEYVDKKVEAEIKHIEDDRFRFGWTIIIWNIVAFVLSFFFCSVAKTISWFVWKVYKFYSNRHQLKKVVSSNEKKISNSKIPVLISKSTTTMKSDISAAKSKFSSDVSCPNLLEIGMRKFDQVDMPCQTLFRNKMFIQGLPIDRNLQNQCAKLREEMLIIQATSLKEHAALSRKLDAVTKEKRELSKQLAIANKENRAAKQQLEELLEEKALLTKRLENATKEYKNNTKSKKIALAKLEEITGNAETLKQRLEQVSRDKEILENKLKLIEGEYEKLKERLRYYQGRENVSELSANLPEKDDNVSYKKDNVACGIQRESVEDGTDLINVNHEEQSDAQPTVSQTELDMRKIQMKIMQLEKNLENFNPKRLEFGGRKDIVLQPEIDSNSVQESTIDAVDENFMENQNNPDIPIGIRQHSPRHQHADKQAKTKLAKLKDVLENIRERSESSETNEPESSCDEIYRPGRIVSNSVAFRNFLKNLNVTDRPLGSPFFPQVKRR